MIYYYLGEAKILQITSGWRGPDVAFVKNNSLRNSGRLDQVNVLCSWARYFTLSQCFFPPPPLPPNPREYKWIPVNYLGRQVKCWGVTL